MSLQPIEQSTIAKLKKLGRISDGDLLGNKLQSDIAKELYKQNLRLHPRYYIPADKRRYFHDAEIVGGKLTPGKVLKKVGSTAKHTFETIGKQGALGIDKVDTGLQTIGRQALEYGKTIIQGRNDYPPKVRDLIDKYGDKVIKSITADRTPVVQALVETLNAVSLGKFKKRLDKKTPYDTLFHLRIDITFEDGSRLAVEKNEVINMFENPKKLKDSEQKEVSNVPTGITLNALLEGGKRLLGGKFFDYDASSNNCQDFIIALLKGSNIGTQEDYTFIKQDTDVLFKKQGFLKKMSKFVTDLGAKVNVITQGAGIYSSDSECDSDYEGDSDSDTSSEGPLRGSGILDKFMSIPKCPLRERIIKGTGTASFTDMPMGDIKSTLMAGRSASVGGRIMPDKIQDFLQKPFQGDFVHIDIGSHSATGKESTNKMTGGKLRRARNTSLEQLLKAYTKKEEKALMKAMRTFYEDRNREISFLPLRAPILPRYAEPLGIGLGAGVGKKIAKVIKDIKPPGIKKAGKYITNTDGLLSDVVNYGIPATAGVAFGALGAVNPALGIATGALGSKLGTMASNKIAKETMIQSRTGEGVRKKFAKGSQEAKEHMAKIRAMRKK